MDEKRPGRPRSASQESEPNNPPTGEVRIAAVEAGVAAGLVGAETGEGTPEQPEPLPAEAEAYELPHWTGPGTGQVPRVLLEDPDAEPVPTDMIRPPTWRQESSDWNDAAADLSFFHDAPDEAVESIAGRNEVEEAPFTFSFAHLDPEAEAPAVEDAPEEAWAELISEREPVTLAEHRQAHRRRRARRPAEAKAHKDGRVATLTGLGLAALVVICLVLGAVATLVLAALALSVAAGEAYAALQRGGYRPAPAVGLLAVPTLVVAAYLHQASGIAVVTAGLIVATALFHLFRPAAEPLVSMSMTLFVALWVGGLGAFAGLLLTPSQFPGGHGVGLVLGALVLTVAHDVGSYLVGARLGRHRLAPRVSPGKSVEGLIGGTVLTLLVAGLGVGLIHPFHHLEALELGIIVSVLAPLGDLTESLVKRDLQTKDMGSLLPGHGGLFDRIDALLFVLPATWCLARVAHLG